MKKVVDFLKKILYNIYVNKERVKNRKKIKFKKNKKVVDNKPYL